MTSKPKKTRLLVLSLALVFAVATGYVAFGPYHLLPTAQAAPIPELGPLGRDASNAVLPADGTFAPVVEAAAPAVVSIATSARVKVVSPMAPFFGNPGQPLEQERRSAGSGVIVTSNGYIVTNHHVVTDAQEIQVRLGDKRTFPAKVIGSDPKADIAVVKVDAKDLPALPLGNSDNVRVGDIVLAVGNPFGIGKTVTMGIVGATGRRGLGIEDYEDFIQTDAAINPGNSGGALINTKGELVGINTAILSRTGGNNGVGFAVPVNLAHNVMKQLIEYGEVRRGYLGVTIQDLTPSMAKVFGVDERGGAVVSDVTPDGPAAKAGIERGDIIVGLNGQPVEDSRALRLSVAALAPGSEAELKVLRNGEPRTLRAKLGLFPDSSEVATSEPGQKHKNYGLSVTNLTPEIARELNLSPGTVGVVITKVDPAGKAAEAGLRRGDVIQEVSRRPVRDIGQFRDAVHAAGDEPLLLLVNRGGRTFYVALPPN